jgi:tRNA threonylcarbamoyladenosine biosynthesis protein TsaB
MTKILALDTATEACSVALSIDGEVVEDYRVAPREHARLLLGVVEDLLRSAGMGLAQMDAIGFGRGPGSFTGVRIAVSVAQGLAFGAGLPVLPVSDLAAMAEQAVTLLGHRRVLAAIDARMGEVYWGAYEADRERGVVLLGEERVMAPAEVPLPAGGGWYGVGSAWGSHADELAERLGSSLAGSDAGFLPRASAVARLAAIAFKRGEALPAEQAMPVYLRDQVAKRPAGPMDGYR